MTCTSYTLEMLREAEEAYLRISMGQNVVIVIDQNGELFKDQSHASCHGAVFRINIAADVVLFGGAGTFDAHACETDFEKIRLENHGLA